MIAELKQLRQEMLLLAEAERQGTWTRELEPGFAGLSFQMIRRNPRAYALYRDAARVLGVELAAFL